MDLIEQLDLKVLEIAGGVFGDSVSRSVCFLFMSAFHVVELFFAQGEPARVQTGLE